MIKDPATMEEPASPDTHTKVIVVFALHNGRHFIVTKVPHNPIFFPQLLLLLLHCHYHSYFYDQPLAKRLQYTYFF